MLLKRRCWIPGEELMVWKLLASCAGSGQWWSAISPVVAKKIIPKIFKANLHEESIFKHKSFESLTEREVEILKLIAQGKSSLEVASYLQISPLTVSTHIKNIYGKMQVRTRAQAVRCAILIGLFEYCC
jgi:DNA-binding NarL/FixJ family response regulator